MIPWIASSVIQLGPVRLQTWGLFVGIGFFVATWIASRRASRHGLDARTVWDVAAWIFLAAMLGARIFHVVFYDPSYYLEHPLDSIDPRQPGFSIMGGFLGGTLAAWRFLQKRGLDFVAYADALAWGLPWGCGVGRIGCFLIHDHPGTLTSFIGGVKYPDGHTRHDLGLYLSIVGFSLGTLFLAFNRKSRTRGFWIGMFLVIDGIVRFCLDFLRVIDRRVFGLTPTQWMLCSTVAIGLWLVLRKPRDSSLSYAST